MDHSKRKKTGRMRKYYRQSYRQLYGTDIVLFAFKATHMIYHAIGAYVYIIWEYEKHAFLSLISYIYYVEIAIWRHCGRQTQELQI